MTPSLSPSPSPTTATATATASVRAVPPRAACWGRVTGAYRSRAVAYLPDGRTVTLGLAHLKSPRLAMRWLRQRAEQLAEQLEAPYARPVQGWIADTAEQGWALDGLAQGDTYVFRATDDEGTLYVLTAEPAALTARPRPYRPVAHAVRLTPGAFN